MTTNTDLFAENFKAVFVSEQGKEEHYEVQMENYFKGHVVGKISVCVYVCLFMCGCLSSANNSSILTAVIVKASSGVRDTQIESMNHTGIRGIEMAKSGY